MPIMQVFFCMIPLFVKHAEAVKTSEFVIGDYIKMGRLPRGSFIKDGSPGIWYQRNHRSILQRQLR